MFFASLGSTLRQCATVPRLTRSVVNRAASRPVPQPRDNIATPADFLKAIGRSSETKIEVGDWETLGKLSSHELKKKGLAVRDRKYILWSLGKYREGLPINSFAHEPKPKKTVRGWGPSVQNGKRILSKADRTRQRPMTTKVKRDKERAMEARMTKRTDRKAKLKAGILHSS